MTVSSHSLNPTHPVTVSFTAAGPGTVLLTLSRKLPGTSLSLAEITSIRVKVSHAGTFSYTLSDPFNGHPLSPGIYALRAESGRGVDLHLTNVFLTVK